MRPVLSNHLPLKLPHGHLLAITTTRDLTLLLSPLLSGHQALHTLSGTPRVAA